MENLSSSIHGKESPTRIRKLYEGWLYKAAYDTFLVKVKQYYKLIDVEIKNKHKEYETEMGSENKVGEINLNINLIKAPEEVIDYIIIHELCHFIIKGHSHLFWELVRSYFPRFQDAISG